MSLLMSLLMLLILLILSSAAVPSFHVNITVPPKHTLMSLELISIGPTNGPSIVYTSSSSSSSSSSSWSLLSFPYTRSEFKSMEYPIRFKARLEKSQSILPWTQVTLETTVWIEKEIQDYEGESGERVRASI